MLISKLKATPTCASRKAKPRGFRPAGRKFKLMNVASEAARFVVVEFPETPGH
jgi:hypothetical protein